MKTFSLGRIILQDIVFPFYAVLQHHVTCYVLHHQAVHKTFHNLLLLNSIFDMVKCYHFISNVLLYLQMYLYSQAPLYLQVNLVLYFQIYLYFQVCECVFRYICIFRSTQQQVCPCSPCLSSSRPQFSNPLSLSSYQPLCQLLTLGW